jgi:hypothetical protein
MRAVPASLQNSERITDCLDRVEALLNCAKLVYIFASADYSMTECNFPFINNLQSLACFVCQFYCSELGWDQKQLEEERMRRYNIGVIACLLTIFLSATSHAVQVSIDSFSISSSTLNFTDGFSDGNPPPCGPGGCVPQPTFYAVNGTLGTESGGLLEMDSANGLSSKNAGGGARIELNVTKAGPTSQLNKATAGAISMTGIFSLSTISGPLNEGYGIRFIDTPPGSGFGSNQQVLELNVQWWTGNATNPAGFYIRYLVQDFNLDTITTVDADLVNVPQGADEVCLSLDRSDPSNNNFSASYAYGTGGACGGNQVHSLGSAAGFAYQDFVRGQFHSFETAVPEPGTWLLMGVGVAVLVLALRQRSILN